MALGFVELPFFSVTAVVADEVLMAADVRLIGIETTGNENLLIRLDGSVGAIETALEFAEKRAKQLGVIAVLSCLSQPDPAMEGLMQFPNQVNPLYGGRDQFLPTDFPSSKSKIMNTKHEAIGIIETQGLAAVLQATDVMLKTANVTLVGKEKIGAAYVAVIVKGDVAAVKAAVEAGAQAVGSLGKLIATHVIARPHEDLIALLPK